MEIIKKNYKKIISYGLIFLGIIFTVLIFILKPQQTITQTNYSVSTTPTLESVSFPFSQNIQISSDNLDYLEIYFGDDSINKYNYTISVSNGSNNIFEHTYQDEQSNIIRIPFSLETSPQSGDNIELKISCNESCKNTKFELYDENDESKLKIISSSHRTDYRYYWYSIFLIAVGLTLLPFAKEEESKKNEA